MEYISSGNENRLLITNEIKSVELLSLHDILVVFVTFSVMTLFSLPCFFHL